MGNYFNQVRSISAYHCGSSDYWYCLEQTLRFSSMHVSTFWCAKELANHSSSRVSTTARSAFKIVTVCINRHESLFAPLCHQRIQYTKSWGNSTVPPREKSIQHKTIAFSYGFSPFSHSQLFGKVLLSIIALVATTVVPILTDFPKDVGRTRLELSS